MLRCPWLFEKPCGYFYYHHHTKDKISLSDNCLLKFFRYCKSTTKNID
nr:MAG TPA: hypothetical protein [Crassvirales sp.]